MLLRQEALNMSVSLHPGQRNRHGQRLGPGTPTSRGGSPHDAGNWVERAPINGAMLLPTYHVRRTVWLLWFQGWGSAPWLVQEVAKSWERHNPGWEVVRLDKQNLGKYMNTKFLFDPANKLQAAAQSDLVSVCWFCRMRSALITCGNSALHAQFKRNTMHPPSPHPAHAQGCQACPPY